MRIPDGVEGVDPAEVVTIVAELAERLRREIDQAEDIDAAREKIRVALGELSRLIAAELARRALVRIIEGLRSDGVLE